MTRRRAAAFALIAAFAGLLPEAAHAADWAVDAQRSRLGFSGTQMGAPFEGTFERFSSTIRFDPADLAGSTVAIVIDMASARTGSSERDEAVRGSDWFATATYPQAGFVADTFRKEGDGRFVAFGTLTIRDVSKPVELPFTLTSEPPGTHAEGALAIDRTAFGVGQGQWVSGSTVGRDVRIVIDLYALPKP